MLTDRTGKQLTQGSMVDIYLRPGMYVAYLGEVNDNVIEVAGQPKHQPYVRLQILVQREAIDGVVPEIYVTAQEPPDSGKGLVS